ncbi:MAG: serine/threonine protein kinase [Acidobacteria bacterium]|nr:serine/threonine protein kinase [Acidobacteriota bacterium]
MTQSAESPATIGRYEVVQLLGRGAVGEVYLARDPALHRRVAIKRLSVLAGLSEDEQNEARARFLREARAAAALSHPNLVTVHDVGEQDGIPYIAMEFLEGTTLDRYTKPGHLLPAVKVLDIGAQSALGIGEAHKRGLVHRDVKPANVVLLADGTAKVTDFGLAKDPRTSLTAADTLLGTPNYMSPEQVAGRTIDGRSDLFSLAVMLYEMLVGRRPFVGDSVSSVLYRIVNEAPPPLAEFNPDLPPSVQAFFDVALSKDPEQRHAGAGEFAAALRTLVRELGGVQEGLELPPPGEAAKFSSANPAVSEKRVAAGEPRARRPRRAWPYIAAAAVLLLVGAWTAPRWLGADPLGGARRPLEDWMSASLGGFGNALRMTAPDRRLAVQTDPPGLVLKVRTGQARLEAGQVVIAGDAAGPIVLEVDDKCRSGEATLEPGRLPDAVRVTTEPRQETLEVKSDPANASVTVDGRAHAERTPASVPLQLCRAHVVEVAAAGRTATRIELSADDTLDTWRRQLAAVALDAPPNGRLAIPSAPGYAVTVFQVPGNRRLGRAGETLELAPGTYRVALRAPEVLYEGSATVNVPSGGAARLGVSFPALGKLSVRTVPGGANVKVRGSHGQLDLGASPVAGQAIAPGTLEVIVENPATGEHVTRSITIRAGEESTVRIGREDWS